MSGHDAGQSHYILILLCVCVSVRMLRVISYVLKKYASISICMCLVRISSFLVMIIMSQIVEVSNIHAGIPCTA